MALTLAVVAACSHSNQPDEEIEPQHEPIPIHVRNENFLDMNIAVVTGGVSRRLGQVTGNSSADFKINWAATNGQQIVLTATPIGGRGSFTSAGVSVGYGQVIELLVGSVLRQSAAVVREPY